MRGKLMMANKNAMKIKEKKINRNFDYSNKQQRIFCLEKNLKIFVEKGEMA